MKVIIICIRLAVFLASPFFLPGCVMQYQRQYLGDPIMLFDGDSEEKSLKTHIYPRREGSSGGDTNAGGGCGC